ncbi:MAG: undecaprenyldiphospho-muramoylpentapeptide beta-N-acetylglucosaminyltransferase, partial [Clostridia bacterium]|nr:undecaprenyldiphospho-muramoylpentapeptide beta-N-acetylglucosaminyltransferase [Clostridia bacterium]
ITLMIGTGSRYHEQFLSQTVSYHINPDKIRILRYIDNMPAVLAACDLAITRAGAMTVSELCAMGKPSILIPSPNVTANHQDKNAEALVKVGAAVKLPEGELTSEKLYQTISRIVKNPATLSHMTKQALTLSITDGDRRIGTMVEQIAKAK